MTLKVPKAHFRWSAISLKYKGNFILYKSFCLTIFDILKHFEQWRHTSSDLAIWAFLVWKGWIPIVVLYFGCVSYCQTKCSWICINSILYFHTREQHNFIIETFINISDDIFEHIRVSRSKLLQVTTYSTSSTYFSI